jgi:hypothetical protein
MEIELLKQQILKSVEQTKDEDGNDIIIFTAISGKVYRMYHPQDCCESVYIDEIIGDLDDLLGVPILDAREDTNSDNPKHKGEDSFTWTFYNILTIKGAVTIRWYGASNGYYSEVAYFEEV